MSSDFRARLRSREKLLGTMVTLPCVAVAEILADAGFDWLFIDAEHGPLETRELAAIIASVDHRIACIIRVARGDEVAIKKALDLGAAGVIVPQVRSAAEAADVVRFSRYAPAGARGVGLARAHGYGFRFEEYLRAANERTAVIVQAEHIDAVEQIEPIVRVEGVDGVLLGPYDLAASMGRMGRIDDPAVVEAIDRVTAVCRAANMPLGYFGVTAEAVRPWMERGYTFIVAGVDTLFIGGAARSMLTQLSDAER